MEIIIVLAVVGVIIAFLIMQRRKELSAEQQPAETAEAAYKLEAPVAESTLAVEPTLAVETSVQVVEEVSAPIVEAPAVKEKKPRKPRAPKVVQSAIGEEPVKAKRKPRSKKA